MKHRVYIVDDHPILREGFAQLLNRQLDFEVCGQAEDAPAALEQIGALKPDLVLLDIELKTSSGVDLIQQLLALHSTLRILALSMHDEALFAERSLRAGALGYVMKQAPVPEVLSAMRRVVRGERYVSPKMQERMLKLFTGPAAGFDRLSNREVQVFQLIGKGLRTREIAETLGLSVKTVETYRAHLIEKLSLTDGAELVHYAINSANLHKKDSAA
jgi:DNA-binding NarL/FixJ family response regulator